MRREDRRKRVYEPQTSQFEYLDLKPEHWYRRGPACHTCQNPGINGIIFTAAYDDGREECAVCTSMIEVTNHGKKETGRVRILHPPEDDTLANNPYLTPLNPRPAIADFEEFMALAGAHDTGNGRRLAARFGEQLRHTAGWGWLVYDGRRWRRDDVGTVERMAKATLEECLAMADGKSRRFWDTVGHEENGPNSTSPKAFIQHIQTSFSRGKIEAMLSMAATEANIASRTEDFDQETWLLNCKNGIVELTSGELRPHDPEIHLTQLVPHDYNPRAECPRWERFIDEITCGDKDLADYLHRAIGYTLTGETSEEKLFFMAGNGSNGKSKFIGALRHVLGDYGTSLSFEALLKSRNTTPEQGFAHLPGKRFATASEGGDGRAWNQEAVKAITGRDVLRGKQLYRDTFEFRPVCKIWVASNGLPRIEDYGEAMWRRLIPIPFNAHFEGATKDEDLEKKLEAEAQGILAWAVRGAMRWYRERLRVAPLIITEALADYKDDNDILGRWISECCVLDKNMSCSAKNLYASFRDFAKANNERELTQTAFGGALGKWKNGRLKKQRANNGIRWMGIITKTQLDAEDAASRGALDRFPDRPSTPSPIFDLPR